MSPIVGPISHLIRLLVGVAYIFTVRRTRRQFLLLLFFIGAIITLAEHVSLVSFRMHFNGRGAIKFFSLFFFFQFFSFMMCQRRPINANTANNGFCHPKGAALLKATAKRERKEMRCVLPHKKFSALCAYDGKSWCLLERRIFCKCHVSLVTCLKGCFHLHCFFIIARLIRAS